MRTHEQNLRFRPHWSIGTGVAGTLRRQADFQHGRSLRETLDHQERGLPFSPDKTHITHIDEGFDFLGQNLRKYGGKPPVKPSLKNTHGFLEKFGV